MATTKAPAHMPATVGKKRAVISYANLSPEILDLWKEKYPRGYADYMEDIMKVDKADGSFFYAVTFEIPDAIYLVKVEVKIDDYDEVEKDIFGSNDDEESSDSDVNEFPDNEDSNFTDAESEEDMDED